MGDAAESAGIDLVLGGFALKQKIGEGGFGTVYLAEQQGLGRTAVVKVMRNARASRAAADRFELEARLASRLDHPCAAHIYAFGAEPDGTLWIAMEYVKGTTLDVFLEAGPISLDRFLPMLERLCEAVQAAHDQGIVHRDIKPSNVMVTAQRGRLLPKLLDFGIAKQVVDAPSVGRANPAPPPPVATATDQTQQWSAAPASGDSLTQAGQILGTPAYMAPEQWMDASIVGPLADQYALGLLAYQALAGRRAFDGTTVEKLVMQHLEQPLPRAPEIPDAVHAVLARATAKIPADRFPTLTELVAALRGVTGWTADVDEPVAMLPPALQATWIERAPQPVAETIAMLGTARSPIRVIERATGVARVIARWVGVLAIACRSRLGRLEGHGRAVDALRQLRHTAPGDEDWIDLAVELARDHADRPELWPIPELVDWCADRDAVDATRRLVRGESALVDAETALSSESESVARRRASTQINLLEEALDGLGWLLDYEIGREGPEGVELWIGARSEERRVRHPASAGDRDRLVVLDADGARIALLSPLVQIHPPVPGEPDEMFVFGGVARSGDGARYTALPRGFEREDTTVWSWLAEHLLDDVGAASRHDDDRPPYPGLASYTADDHASFVGREREASELLNRLRTTAIVAVIGPSGAGKSSFVAAGVIPAFPAGWIAASIRPGRAPISALASVVDRLDSPYRDGSQVALTSSTEIAERLIALAERSSSTIVVIVDQAEELFTQGADEVQRCAFAQALVELARHPRGRVLIGVRDDFLCRVDDLAPWRGRLGRAIQILGVPSQSDLERIVVEPARRRGYTFDDPELPHAMAAELADRPGALPLLSFVANELWAHRDRHFLRITKASYERCGGVTGALVQHADSVVDRMAAGDRRLVRLVFQRLLTAEGARVVLGRDELVAALGEGDARATVVEHLLAARLIVSRDDDAGERVEIIHEALATMWPRLAEWRRDDAANTKLCEQLAAAARHWADRDRPTELLWRGDALAELRRGRANGDLITTPVEQAFADASEIAARRSRRRRIVGGTAGVAGLATAVVVLALLNRKISSQRADAEQRVVSGLEARARLSMVEGQTGQAIVYLSEAQRLGAGGPSHELLLARATSSVEALDGIVIRDQTTISSAEFGEHVAATIGPKDARLWDLARGISTAHVDNVLRATIVGGELATLSQTGELAVWMTGGPRWHVDGEDVSDATKAVEIAASTSGHAIATFAGTTVHLWELGDGRPRATLTHAAPVLVAAFDPSGSRLAVFDQSGALTVWNAMAGTKIATCSTPAANAWSIAFVPMHELAVVGGSDGVIRICDVTTGDLVHRIAAHRTPITVIGVSDDGKSIVSGGVDGSAHRWDVATGAWVGGFVGHHGAVRAMRFSADRRRLATGGDDATVRIWDSESGAQLATLPGHANRVTDVSWESATRLVSASFDGTIRRWKIDGAIRDAITHAYDKLVVAAVATDHAVTVGDDGTAAVWDSRAGSPVATLHHDTAPIIGAALAGDLVVTAHAEGSVRLWSQAGALQRTIDTGDGALSFVAASRDGQTIATAAKTGAIRLWSRDGKALAVARIGFAPEHLMFDPDGRWLVAAARNSNDAVVIDPRSAAVTRLPVDAGPIYKVAFDHTRIAIAAARRVHLFQLGTWEATSIVAGSGEVYAVALLEDGRTVTANEDAVTAVWDRDNHLITRLPTGTRGVDVEVSPDNNTLAIGTADGAVEIWSTSAYRQELVFRGHRGWTDIRFTMGGARVFSLGNDGRVGSWDLSRRALSNAELTQLAICRVPLRLEGDTLLPREIDFDDPACR